ncbi:MAG: hypothetical protein J6T22_09060 [Bacteroidales bacterium]|nr:hypothetical protein [Bacteroidales bacterium]
MDAVFTKKSTAITFEDDIVIRKFIGGLEGGRTLDCTGFPEKVVKAGHVVIKLASGNYAPMPITSSNAYDSLPSGASYAGILYRSVSVDNPSASILTNGEVNPKAVPYAMDSIMSAFKSACPFIEFESDENSNNPLAVANSAMSLTASSSDTTTISGAIGTVTATSNNDKISGSVSGTTLTVTAAEEATGTGVITLTDEGGQTATVAVTITA